MTPPSPQTSPREPSKRSKKTASFSKVLNEEFGLEGRPEIHSLLAIPGMFKMNAPEIRNDEERRAAVENAFDEALAGLDRERCREGLHLREELLSRHEKISALTAEIRERAAGMPDCLRDRLLERLQALAMARKDQNSQILDEQKTSA